MSPSKERAKRQEGLGMEHPPRRFGVSSAFCLCFPVSRDKPENQVRVLFQARLLGMPLSSHEASQPWYAGGTPLCSSPTKSWHLRACRSALSWAWPESAGPLSLFPSWGCLCRNQSSAKPFFTQGRGGRESLSLCFPHREACSEAILHHVYKSACGQLNMKPQSKL